MKQTHVIATSLLAALCACGTMEPDALAQTDGDCADLSIAEEDCFEVGDPEGINKLAEALGLDVKIVEEFIPSAAELLETPVVLTIVQIDLITLNFSEGVAFQEERYLGASYNPALTFHCLFPGWCGSHAGATTYPGSTPAIESRLQSEGPVGYELYATDFDVAQISTGPVTQNHDARGVSCSGLLSLWCPVTGGDFIKGPRYAPGDEALLVAQFVDGIETSSDNYPPAANRDLWLAEFAACAVSGPSVEPPAGLQDVPPGFSDRPTSCDAALARRILREYPLESGTTWYNFQARHAALKVRYDNEDAKVDYAGSVHGQTYTGQVNGPATEKIYMWVDSVGNVHATRYAE